MSIAGQRCSQGWPNQPDNLRCHIALQIGMRQGSPQGPLRYTSLTFWIIAATIAVVVAWAVWHFGRLSQHPAPNNPGVSTSSELIVNKV